MPPSFAEAIHLVSSSSAAGCLLQAGARRTRIHGTDAYLTSGACDIDPIRHEELRRRDTEPWMHLFGLEDLRAAVAGDAPVVLWGSHAYSDLVWLWWALDGLGRIGAERARCFIARPRPEDPRNSAGGATAAAARVALDAARQISPEEWRDGAELWIKFASPSPLAFDEARRTGSIGFPEITGGAELHGAWFPRLMHGHLRLSELDEVLLGGMADAWRTTSELLETLSLDRAARLAWPFHPLMPIYRLRAWATHGVLEREVLDDEDPWLQDRFRATDRTRALLDEGLRNVGDAPQHYVGGCVVNDPTSPWVRIENDAGWRIALHGP